jgi:DNA-binding CsgD family transcriptional regulator
LDLVEAAVRTGRLVEAGMHVAAVQQAGVAHLSPRFALLVDAATALVTSGPSAQDDLERALRRPGIERWPFDVARVELLLGDMLRETGEHKESRFHSEVARQTFDELGSGPWSRRAGGPARGVDQARLCADGSGQALTGQEMEIASLAAGGLTNREIGERVFLSHRTVGAHLYRIFPKLGVSTRAGLRDALAATESESIEVVG